MTSGPTEGGAQPPEGLLPSDAQRAALAARDAGPVALLDLLGSGEPDAFVRHCEGSLAAVQSSGGRRVYGGALDRSTPGRPRAHYDAVVLDEFPSRRSCLRALESAPDPRGALRARCTLPVAPSPALERLAVQALRLLALLWPARLSDDPGPFPGDVRSGSIGVTPEEAQAFMEAEQHLSLVVVNLNRYRPRALPVSGVEAAGAPPTGAVAYARYGRNTAPLVFRRGGRVLFAGQPEPPLVGAPDDPIAGPWDAFVLVYYPSRLAMRDMIHSEAYARGTPWREAGLAQAVVAPGTPWPAFDPKG